MAYKGDVRIPGLARIECKTVLTPHKTFRVQRQWFEKVADECVGGEVPLLVFSFDNQTDFVACALEDLPAIVHQFHREESAS
ncbi:MAG: hypothetical protein K6V97_06705 [Actinomycetia bacterium]|nr:hypothetical protein [Actinomycetes bacterium]